MKRALLYVFIFLAIQFVAQFITMMLYSVTHGGLLAELPAVWSVASILLSSVATMVVFLLAKWHSTSHAYLRSRPWSVLLWSVVAALGAIVPSLLLQGLLPEWTGWAHDMAQQTEQQLSAIMSVRGGYMAIALLAPVVEEMVFRGAVLGSLLRWRPQRRWLMIVLSAVLFALVHINPAQLPHTFLVGLLLGWMYARTGSIVPGIAYHWANNTAAFLMYHLYHNPQSLTDIVGPGTRATLLALLFSLCILLPALLQLHLRMRRVQ